MAKVLERRETLYDEDLLAWAEQQAEHLRAGRLDALDVVHLLEELEAMAGNQRRELRSRLGLVLLHMLKYHLQPRRRSRSWLSTMIEQRAQIRNLLDESPSLRPRLKEMARRAYVTAVERAAVETGLPRRAFPPELPFSVAEIRGDTEEQQPA